MENNVKILDVNERVCTPNKKYTILLTQFISLLIFIFLFTILARINLWLTRWMNVLILKILTLIRYPTLIFLLFLLFMLACNSYVQGLVYALGVPKLASCQN